VSPAASSATPRIHVAEVDCVIAACLGLGATVGAFRELGSMTMRTGMVQ
jgi:hypothetical protein